MPRSKKELEITKEMIDKEKTTESKTPEDMKKDLGKIGIKQLTDIAGIGPKTAEKLNEKLQIESIEDLAVSRTDEVAQTMGVTFAVAKSWVMSAQEALLSEMTLESVDSYDETKKLRIMQFKTGSKKFNAMLGGGITTMAITGTAGRMASGKTCIGTDIVIDAIHNHYTCPKCGIRLSKTETCKICKVSSKPVEAVIIETEPDTIHLDRLKEIAKHKGYTDIDWTRLLIVPASKVATIRSQFLWYKAIKHAIDNDERNIHLIVIDSFNAKLRAGWSRSEMLPIRTREVAEHINLMEFMATKYNIAWYITAQVIAPPRPDQGLAMKVKFTDQFYPVGGDLLLHSVNQWIALTNPKTEEYKAAIFDSSYLPRATCSFVIDKSGIMDGID